MGQDGIKMEPCRYQSTVTGLILKVNIHWAMSRSGSLASPSSSMFSLGILALVGIKSEIKQTNLIEFPILIDVTRLTGCGATVKN